MGYSIPTALYAYTCLIHRSKLILIPINYVRFRPISGTKTVAFSLVFLFLYLNFYMSNFADYRRAHAPPHHNTLERQNVYFSTPWLKQIMDSSHTRPQNSNF